MFRIMQKPNNDNENNYPNQELRRGSTRFGVEWKWRFFYTPSCASLARGYQCKSPSGTEKSIFLLKSPKNEFIYRIN